MKLSKMEMDLKAARTLIREQETELRTLETNLSASEAKILRNVEEIKSLSNKVEDLNSLINQFQTRIDGLEKLKRELSFEIDGLKQEKEDLKFELKSATQKVERLTSKNTKLQDRIEELTTLNKNYMDEIEALKRKLLELENTFTKLELEYKQIIDNWTIEREKILEENQRLQFISRDRLQDIEKKSWENGRLLMKVALAYAELDRLSKFREAQSGAKMTTSQVISDGNMIVLSEGDVVEVNPMQKKVGNASVSQIMAGGGGLSYGGIGIASAEFSTVSRSQVIEPTVGLSRSRVTELNFNSNGGNVGGIGGSIAEAGVTGSSRVVGSGLTEGGLGMAQSNTLTGQQGQGGLSSVVQTVTVSKVVTNNNEALPEAISEAQTAKKSEFQEMKEKSAKKEGTVVVCQGGTVVTTKQGQMQPIASSEAEDQELDNSREGKEEASSKEGEEEAAEGEEETTPEQ
jgi:hypothetical protein